ncbi:MAG: fatty acid desaturase [Gammaproteobacteria bacterium]|nr:fatty acid desaturase [Gammaproteobacteria bacterium]
MGLYGLLDLSFWGHVGVTLLLTHITIVSVTIFLHRHQAHLALKLRPSVSHFFRFWLWLTTGAVTKEWVAVHRKHHAKCESEDDPHSPQRSGISAVLFGGYSLYRKEADKPETLSTYGRGTPDDWLERNLYARHAWHGLILMAVLDLVLFGVAGLAIFAVQFVWIPFWAAGVINGLGHYMGYRNFETQDASRNLVPIGLLIGGEELHNNHHAYAQSARLSNKWWEFDVGWMYIRILESAGLAEIRSAAPKTYISADKESPDLDTVRAILRNRFHILTLYSRNVIMPVLRQERRSANQYWQHLFSRAKYLMTREDIVLNDKDLKTLNDALTRSHALRTVYHFKQQLKSLWANSGGDQAKRVSRLQTWCAEAEQTGIMALTEFAQTIRGYTMRPIRA